MIALKILTIGGIGQSHLLQYPARRLQRIAPSWRDISPVELEARYPGIKVGACDFGQAPNAVIRGI
jgi:hypothetical protein